MEIRTFYLFCFKIFENKEFSKLILNVYKIYFVNARKKR